MLTDISGQLEKKSINRQHKEVTPDDLIDLEIQGMIKTALQFIQSCEEPSNYFLTNEEDENLPKGICKRKDGRYMVRKQKEGFLFCDYAKTKNQAILIYRKLCKQPVETLIAEAEQKEKKKDYTFQQWTDIWLEEYKKPFIKKKSLSDIKTSIKNFVNKFAKTKLKDITGGMLQKYFNSREKNRTKERTYTYVNAILQKATDLELIKKNPFVLVQKDKKISWKRTTLNFDQQQHLLQTTKNTDIYVPVLIYLLTGCRPSEFPKQKDIDLKDKIINIFGTKNETSKHRQVDISKSFANLLENYLKNNILPSYKKMQKRYVELLKDSDIPSNLYYLRHTFATNMRVMGADIKQVSYYMGHSTTAITLDVYTDIDKTLTKQKLKAIYNDLYIDFKN